MRPAPVTDTPAVDPELARNRERAECDRVADLIWAKVHLSRHTMDGLGLLRLLVAATALGIDTSKGQ